MQKNRKISITFRYRPPKSLLAAYRRVALASARHASGFPDAYSYPDDRGVAMRKCLATLAKVRGVAVIIAEGDQTAWRRHRTGVHPPAPQNYGAMALWIAAAAFRDHHRLTFHQDVPLGEILDIKLRQTNLLSLIGALPLDSLVVAGKELLSRTRFERQKSAAKPTARKGSSLRLVKATK